MPSLTQRLVDFWGTQTARAIGTVVLLGTGAFNLLFITGTFALVSGVVFLAVGLLMLYDTLVE